MAVMSKNRQSTTVYRQCKGTCGETYAQGYSRASRHDSTVEKPLAVQLVYGTDLKLFIDDRH